uniref:Uncharacterized protein n=1 Tax=Magallana gigas TaxID=29159 RepID=K1Q2T7_MAGGI|eukprot:XP_011449225.1 PREDICTED: uncharacterized protein LOC105343531 [Crassostrea gigas]
MANIKHPFTLCLAVLMVTQSNATSRPLGGYVYLTNKPKTEDQFIYVQFEIGSQAKSTNYEIRHNENGCYNLTNLVVESIGSMGSHDWLEVTFGDCLCGRDIVEHRYTEEEPFSVINVYWYNRHIYSGDPEKPLTCSPIKYRYHVIFTLSKDPDEQIKQMIQHFVEENKIEGLYRQDHYECDGLVRNENVITEESQL